MAFRSVRPSSPAPADPKALFGRLPRSGQGVENLWGQQGWVLDEYHRSHLETTDLAIELPTGTGKTLIGLLLAEWRRRTDTARVAYACPTRQLADQVAATAAREGIDVVTLTGPSRDWPGTSRHAYESGAAVAITTYSTIFNSNPQLPEPRYLLFDDAHAGEQYVASAWSVHVSRSDHPNQYRRLAAALATLFDQHRAQRLLSPEPDPLDREWVEVLPMFGWPDRIAAVESALEGAPRDIAYPLSTIRPGLPACVVYVAADSILIRPFIPPTFDHPHFEGAAQRLYLSATLGAGGELERAFGRRSISRLGVPEGVRVGRRFFVFPHLAEGGEPEALSRQVISAGGRVLLLGPSGVIVDRAADALLPVGYSRYGKPDLEAGLLGFTAEERSALLLAGRYDGIDLPGETCRQVALVGVPNATHLQERFLSGRLRAQVVLDERIRTRVVQGTGRCTRGPADFATVIVADPKLQGFLSRPENRRALTPDLQVELAFGFENASMPPAEVIENVQHFLNQDETWRNAEQELADMMAGVEVEPPAAAEVLSGSVHDEVTACDSAWTGNWSAAAAAAQRAAHQLGGTHTRSFRAWWLYLASVWASREQQASAASVQSLFDQAEAAAQRGTWLCDAPPDQAIPGFDPGDIAGIEQICAMVERGVNRSQHDQRIERMLAGLAGTEAGPFEQSLSTLGNLIGAEAEKPQGQGRADSTWRWGRERWLALEAKSEHQAGGVVSLADVRQANTQLRSMADDHSEEVPEVAATVILSPRETVHPDAVPAAEPHVHLAPLKNVRALGARVQAAWDEVVSGSQGLTGEALRTFVEGIVVRRGLRSCDVFDDLTTHPINEGAQTA